MLKDADPAYFAGIYIVCGYTDLRYGIDSLASSCSRHNNNPSFCSVYSMILSILVDTFISKISFPMQPGPEIGSISDA